MSQHVRVGRIVFAKLGWKSIRLSKVYSRYGRNVRIAATAIGRYTVIEAVQNLSITRS